MADADERRRLRSSPNCSRSGDDDTPYRLVTTEGVSTFDTEQGTFLKVEPEAIRRLTAEAMHDIAHFLRPGHLQQLRNILDDPEASDERPVRRHRPAQERRGLGGRGAADVPGHRHGDRQGQEGSVRVHRRWRRAGDRPRHPGHVPDEQPALQPDGAAHDVRREEHRHEPARRDQDLGRRRRGTRPTSSCSSPRAAAAPTRATCTRRRRRCSTRRRCSRGSSRRSRRSAPRPARRTTWRSSIGGTSAEFAVETAKLASTRYLDTLPTEGSALGHGFRDTDLEAEGARPRTDDRDRRPVRRQVLLPRRPHRPAAAPRRQLPGGDRRVVLGRPPGARQDHPRRRVPGTARARPGPVPPRRHPRRPRGRRRRAHRPQPADGRDPRRAVEVPGQDAGDADRPDGRRSRHRPRQDQGTPRRRRADAAVPEGPLRLLRRARPRPPRATRRVRSGRRRPVGWTPTSSSSRPPAGRW